MESGKPLYVGVKPDGAPTIGVRADAFRNDVSERFKAPDDLADRLWRHLHENPWSSNEILSLLPPVEEIRKFKRAWPPALTIDWEGESFFVGPEDRTNFVDFCEQLGVDGRRALLDVLTVNYRQEVLRAMGRL